MLNGPFTFIFSCNYLGKGKDQIHRKCVTVRMGWGEGAYATVLNRFMKEDCNPVS
jgi:hypothetical protein